MTIGPHTGSKDSSRARRKLSLLQLAQDLGNVSKACRILGYSRQHFQRDSPQLPSALRRGAARPARGAKEPHPKRVAPPIEKAILAQGSSLRPTELSEEQIQAPERFDPEFRERHIEVHATGLVVAVDTFFAGTLKDVGEIYIQTVLDCFSLFVCARLHTSKMPVTAVQILGEAGCQVITVCGRPEMGEYGFGTESVAVWSGTVVCPAS